MEAVEGTIRMDPDELFVGLGSEVLSHVSLVNLWQWAYSDIVANTNRGVLAEFIVATALKDCQIVRSNWAEYDVKTPDGVKVEVKSSAYSQSWAQKDFSKPRFGIGKTFGWDPDTDKQADSRGRHSDVHVFCLLAYRGDKRTLNPLDLGQWEFYVVPTSAIEAEFGDGQSISLLQVQRLAEPVSLDGLANAVADAI